jgi:hypothetical protein
MSKTTDPRKLFISDVRKGKFDAQTIHMIMKYNFNAVERRYIIEKLGRRHFEITYCNPMPLDHVSLGKYNSFLETSSSLTYEIDFFLEGLTFFKKELNTYLALNDQLERSVLANEKTKSLDILDEMDSACGHSLYSLLSEYYINEYSLDQDDNHGLLKYLSSNNAEVKLIVLMNLTRFRIDQNVSSLSYEGAIEQHRLLYDSMAAFYLDLINFRFDLLHAIELKDFKFILSFESDFAIIDRYQTLKKILPLLLEHKNVNASDKAHIIKKSLTFFENIDDPYGINFKTLYGDYLGPHKDRSNFHEIQDLFFEGNYEQVLYLASTILRTNPNYSEIYLPFLQALIMSGKQLPEFFSKEAPLYTIFELMISVLEKKDSYNTQREKLLKKYYALSHFDFATHILEFVYNEYHLVIKTPIQTITFLSSPILRYNAFKVFKTEEKLINLLKSNAFKTENYLVKIIEEPDKISAPKTFLQLKVQIGYYVKHAQYEAARNVLLNLPPTLIKMAAKAGFVHTWIQRNLVKCHIATEKLGDAADIIVKNFFEKNFAYQHFVNSYLFEKLSDPFETRFSEHISIPILFEIYHQPQSAIYDVIANFLVANKVFTPSELIPLKGQWHPRYFNYFLEKCCIKENLEDSPFYRNITLLEEERKKIINYLKLENPDKVETYNKEILKISQDATLRKGLLQIHESRIYVDESGIVKLNEINLREVFDTYMSLNDKSQLNVSIMKLGEFYDLETKSGNYYFAQPVSEEVLMTYDLLNDPWQDPNVVPVSEIKYQYYVALFNSLTGLFVFDEDYGFKSFLSMRIRHGTFSNVLRSVFEKHDLISSKASNSNAYQEIKAWEEKIESGKHDLQELLKSFSQKIDQIIDDALGWLVIKGQNDEENANKFFDFGFGAVELDYIYRNRIGRISEFQVFTKEVFTILFERLELCLTSLREQIATVLTHAFVEALEELQRDVGNLKLTATEHQQIEQVIVNCRTEIQSATTQIENWFRISKNRYIEEFPFELILDTIKTYINSIYANALSDATLKAQINCSEHIKGKYFEPFGDILINIFENIITKNKDIKDTLVVDIEIASEADLMTITVSNNLSPTINVQDLEKSIKKIQSKIDNYKSGMEVSFERGSGYIKLCKSVSVDLERKEYTITPAYANGKFEVKIMFNTDNLFS